MSVVLLGDGILRHQTIQDGCHRGDTLDQPNAMLVDEVLTYTTRRVKWRDKMNTWWRWKWGIDKALCLKRGGYYVSLLIQSHSNWL